MARRADNDRHPALDGTRCHSAAEATKIRVRTVDPLYRQAKTACRIVPVGFSGFKQFQDSGTVVPWNSAANRTDVLACQRRNRHGGNILKFQLACESFVIVRDGLEHRGIVANKIHLVDCQNDMANTHQ